MTLRRSSAALLLASTGLFPALGCEEEKIITSPNAGVAAGGAGAEAPAAASGQPPRAVIDEAEFVENDRSRDPFRSFARSFVEESKGRPRSQRDVVLAEYALDELKLIGIVTRVNPAKAMLLDPVGKGHVIQRGQFVGRADLVQTSGNTGTTYEVNWRVDRIRDGDVVFVREDPQNPDVPTITRVIPLRTEGAIVDAAASAELRR